MMKYSKIYILVFIVFAISLIIYLNNQRGTLNYKLNFSSLKTTEVKSILIKKADKQVLLTNQSQQWYLSNFKADEYKVQQIIQMIKSLRLLSPLSVDQIEEVEHLIKSEGIFVKIDISMFKKHSFYIYTDNKRMPVKNYIKINNKQAFEVYIPSFESDIARLFSVKESDWKTKLILNEPMEKIAFITVEYPEKEHTYKLQTNGGKILALYNAENNLASNTDSFRIISYLQLFDAVYVDSYISKQDYPFQEKLASLHLQTINKELKSYNFYAIKDSTGVVNPFHLLVEIGQTDYAIMRYLITDPILKKHSYFIKD
jgi:hypothetical protein